MRQCYGLTDCLPQNDNAKALTSNISERDLIWK